MMPPCGTFEYIGVVPDTEALRNSGQWTLEDRSGAPPITPLEHIRFWNRDSLIKNRFVGLRPTLRISGGRLVLNAPKRLRASVREAGLELDPSLTAQFRGGDVLTLVRTPTANIGVSLFRAGQLICSVGAVTAVPLGNEVAASGGPEPDTTVPFRPHGPGEDTWVNFTVSGRTSRLRDGEEATIGEYRASVVHSFKYTMPGDYESVAISLVSVGLHEAAVESAKLLARWNAGLWFKKW